MRLSMLASSVLAVGFMSLSTAAYAGCGSSLTCNSNQGYSSYSSGYSGGYSSSHSTSSYGGTASCPAGTRASSDGTCLMNETTSLYSGGSSYSSSYTPSTSYSSSSSYTPASNYSSSYSSSSYTPSTSYSSYSSSYTPSYSSGYSSSSSSSACPSGSSRGVDGLCMSHNSGSSYSSGGSYSSSSYSSGGSTIVPFSTSVSNISHHRINGMGANESLSPTACPVSVYNPGGGKVLGCYSVVKPAPIIVRPAPVIIQRPVYHTVRVVRPIIYVRYPVPVAVPYYRPTCGGTTWSRYGSNWPRAGWGSGCRGW